MSRTAGVLYQISARDLSENIAIDTGKGRECPNILLSKDAPVKDLKDALAYIHKATNSLANQSLPRRSRYNARLMRCVPSGRHYRKLNASLSS